MAIEKHYMFYLSFENSLCDQGTFLEYYGALIGLTRLNNFSPNLREVGKGGKLEREGERERKQEGNSLTYLPRLISRKMTIIPTPKYLL